MIIWYWYLLSAAALSVTGYIRLDLFLTMAIAILVHSPLRMIFPRAHVLLRLRTSAAAAAAIALLWRESYLPPAARLISFLADPVTRPSSRYILEFIRQSFNFNMLIAAVVIFAAVIIASRKRPLSLVITAYFLLITAWIMQPKHSLPDLGSESPEAFYRKEASRMVKFPVPAKNSPPFDVFILHICSLSWQDLNDSGSDLTPFFSKFDYVFTDFSAGCSYSGPAALRVLKAPCGQLPHPLLYTDSPPGCYLMDNLRAAGFTTYTMLSHNGRYADFISGIQKYGHADPPLGAEGLPIQYRMFDGSPLYSDYAALDRFWKVRSASGAKRAALYYNTANLHIGTHPPGAGRGPDDAASYRQRLKTMAAQIDDFFSEVEKSGRNAVVIFVPEHGAALSGTKMQAKDIREIPLPSIAILPAAVKLIGKVFYRDIQKPQIITKPASLQALAWLTAEFLRNNPFAGGARKPDIVAAEIPGTDFMAENENAAVFRSKLGYIYRQKNGTWGPLPAYAAPSQGAVRPGFNR